VSLGKLNFGAPDWILGGWVVLENKVCYHNYTTPANERGPATTHTSSILLCTVPRTAEQHGEQLGAEGAGACRRYG
jgi:hypothetical protein